MKRYSTVLLFLFGMLTRVQPVHSQVTGTFIQADDAQIRYTGRIDFTQVKAPMFSFPGVTITARFTGTQLYGVIKDYGTGGDQTTNYYEVILDGQLRCKIQVNNVDTLYLLADGLPNTTHDVSLVKRTESSVGKSSFKGFVIEGSALETLPAANTRKIEFIGDSWTCGYGNEVSTTSPNTGFHSVNEDNYRTWGYTVSKRFNADYHCTAISGRGLYRNNTGTTYGVLPDEFNKMFPGEATVWNFNAYVPDLVVIHLGTNDFYPETWSTPSMLDSAAFVDKYIAFITSIRGAYGSGTKIICAFGNSKSDWWPTGLYHLTRWRNYVTAVVNHFNTGGDNLVYKFELSVQNPPYGEDWHPTIVTHNQMANEISAKIASVTGWSDNAYVATTSTVTPVIGRAATLTNTTLSPNPTVGYFSIEGINENTPWVITDSTGKIQLTGMGTEGNIEALPRGIYFLTADRIFIKIIKQ